MIATKTHSTNIDKTTITCLFFSIGAVILAWQRSDGGAFDDLSRNPLMNPLLPCITTLFAVLANAVLVSFLPKLFIDKSRIPATLVGIIALLITPFHYTSGLLFGVIILLSSVIFSLFIYTSAKQRQSTLASSDGIRGIFFLSGMAALIYQVVWQRKLIEIIGVDGQSVTLIVAVFMGGLGIGALIGEALAGKLNEKRCIYVFCGVELLLSLIGISSIHWIEFISSYFSSHAPIAKVMMVACALGLPVMLMGLTLPLLVNLLRSRVPQLRENVGKLYALNALGSGLAALLAATMLFPFTGLIGATQVAAGLNAFTALLVFIAGKHWINSPINPVQPVAKNDVIVHGSMSLALVAAFAVATGFLCIGQEILLIRMMSWATATRPWTFGLAVGSFLVGMGMGCMQIALSNCTNVSEAAFRRWLLSGAVLLFTPVVAAGIGSLTTPMFGAIVLSICLGVLGYLGGSSLPLIAAMVEEVPDKSSMVGIIYAANIVGSVIGSILTGYVLLDLLPLHQVLIIFAVLSVSLSIVFSVFAFPHGYLKSMPLNRLTIVLVVFILALPFSGNFYVHWREWLYQSWSAPDFISTIETRSGIIAVIKDERGGDDIVVGGGAYDGRFNVNPVSDSNIISRIYVAIAMHDNPESVLEIGLSSGSWAKAILSFPAVKRLTAVELNHGYLPLVKSTALVSDITHDPRLTVVIDDGRQWLLANDEKWNLIIVNASFHWREGSTLLHSSEFMQLVKSRLKPGGMLLINTTGARAITATALSVFPEVWRVSNALVAINNNPDRLVGLDLSLLGQRLSSSAEFINRNLTGEKADSWLKSHTPIRENPNDFKTCPILHDDAMRAEWGRAECN